MSKWNYYKQHVGECVYVGNRLYDHSIYFVYTHRHCAALTYLSIFSHRNFMFLHFSMRRVILNMNRALKQLTTTKLDKHSQNTWQDKTRHVKITYNILLVESHYLFNLSVQWPLILNDEYHTVHIWCLSLVICLRVKTVCSHTYSHSTGQIKCSIQSDNHNNDFFQCKCQMAIILYVPFLFGVSSGAFHYRLGSLVDIAHIRTQSHSDIQRKQKGEQQKLLIHYNGHFLRSTLIWFAAQQQ